MKKRVLTFGLIPGAISGGPMLATIPFVGARSAGTRGSVVYHMVLECFLRGVRTGRLWAAED